MTRISLLAFSVRQGIEVGQPNRLIFLSLKNGICPYTMDLRGSTYRHPRVHRPRIHGYRSGICSEFLFHPYTEGQVSRAWYGPYPLDRFSAFADGLFHLPEIIDRRKHRWIFVIRDAVPLNGQSVQHRPHFLLMRLVFVGFIATEYRETVSILRQAGEIRYHLALDPAGLSYHRMR